MGGVDGVDDQTHIQINYATAQSPREKNVPVLEPPASPRTIRQWAETCVWFPFLVSLTLWIIYAKILPSSTKPTSVFLDALNPQTRDDVALPPQASTIGFMHMVSFFMLLWVAICFLSEVVFPWSSTKNKFTLLLQFLTLSMAFTEAYFLTNATTDFIKFRVGALRPDFLSRCFGKDFDINSLPTSLVNGTASCTSKDTGEIEEGMVSFPSGHTSVGINMGMFITLYIFWCLYMRNRTYIINWIETFSKKSSLNKALVQFSTQASFFVALTPLFLGYGVAMTRLTDFRHHFVDVLMGALIGTFFTTIVFSRTIHFFKE